MGPTTRPSATKAALTLMWRGLRRDAGDPRQVGPQRALSIEHRGLVAEPREVRRFVRATFGADDSRIVEATAPACFPAVWQPAMALELLARGRLPVPRAGIVHVGGSLLRVRPIRIGSPLRARMHLEHASPLPSGDVVSLRTRYWDAAGRLIGDDRLDLLLRGVDTGIARPTEDASADGATTDVPDDGWIERRRWHLSASAGRRYARVSGDYNPIHLSAMTARPFGYRRSILHGFCIQAMVANALAASGSAIGDGPATLRIRFRAPLELPGNARLLSRQTGDNAGDFRLFDERREKPVADGRWGGA